MKLNDEQMAIVNTISDEKIRFVNICAGPGSGKSSMIAELIVNFIKYKYSLNDFLCISFTNESWRELRSKILEKCNNIHNNQFKNLTITTFHKYCASLCNIEKDYNEKSETELKNLTREDKTSIKSAQLDELIKGATDSLNFYSNEKNNDTSYESNQVNEFLLKKKVLFLDEAQDLTPEIYKFVCALMRAVKIANDGEDLKVYAFSDSDQSIFEFNGANHEHIEDLMKYSPKLDKEFDKKLDDTETLYLTSNYRSNGNIVNFTENYRETVLLTNSSRNSDKRMKSSNKKKGSKKSVQFYQVNEDNYCNAIIDIVKSNIDKIKPEKKIGILVPKNKDAHNIYEILKNEINDPNVIIKTTGNSATSFKLIKLDEFHSLLRILYEAFNEFHPYTQNGRAMKSLTRVEQPEPPMMPMDAYCFGDDIYGPTKITAQEYNLSKCIEKFKNAYTTSKYTDAVINFFDDFRKCYEGERYYNLNKENISDNINKVFNQSELDAFIELLNLYPFDDFCYYFVENKDIHTNDSSQKEITISTIHKAKGLEFDYVYMTCLQKEKKWLSKENEYGLEKCRYVAMTRAISELHIFNDRIEEKYCLNFDTDKSNIKADGSDSVILAPNDLALSYLMQTFKTSFSYEQFIPYYKEKTLQDIQCLFCNTPSELQTGSKLHLENILSTSGHYRFVLYNMENDIRLERISKSALGGESQMIKYDNEGNSYDIDFKNSDSFVIDFIKKTYKAIYKEVEKLDYPNAETIEKRKREIIDKANAKFIEWCDSNLDIEIEAIIIVDDISAPWTKDGQFYEEFLQDYRYYSSSSYWDTYEKKLKVDPKQMNESLKSNLKGSSNYNYYYEYDPSKKELIKKTIEDNTIVFEENKEFFRRKLIIPKITLKQSSHLDS